MQFVDKWWIYIFIQNLRMDLSSRPSPIRNDNLHYQRTEICRLNQSCFKQHRWRLKLWRLAIHITAQTNHLPSKQMLIMGQLAGLGKTGFAEPDRESTMVKSCIHHCTACLNLDRLHAITETSVSLYLVFVTLKVFRGSSFLFWYFGFNWAWPVWGTFLFRVLWGTTPFNASGTAKKEKKWNGIVFREICNNYSIQRDSAKAI